MKPTGDAEHRYRDLVQTLEAIVWEFDPESKTLTFISQRAEEMLGYPTSRWLDDAEFWRRTVHPQDYEGLVAAVLEAMQQGRDVELEYRMVADDGRTVWLHDHVYVVPDDESRPKLRGLAVDITERKRAERRREAEHAAARALADADDLAQAAPEILQGLCDALDWDTGSVWIIHPATDELRCEHIWARNRSFTEFLRSSRDWTFKRGERLPGHVWETAEPDWILDIAADPGFVRAPAALAEGLQAAFAFPIIGRRRVLGVMEFFSREVEQPDDRLRGSLMTIGAQIGQFIRRKETEAALRDSEEWLGFLAEANTLLSTSLRFSVTLERLAQMSVPYLADWCVIDVVEPDGSLRRVSAVDEDAVPFADPAATTERDSPDPHALVRSTKTGDDAEPLLYAEVDDEVITKLARDDRQAHALAQCGIGSLMWVPLVARGRPLGTITFAMAGSGRRYDERILRRVEDLARRAALAVDNARLYEDRARVARTLQKSLLPPHIPEIPGLDIAARYIPAGEGIEVGGDFYDVFPTGARSWALALGDVCGKGAEAAALTALTRYTLRTAAMQASKPSEILAILNEAILRHGTDDRFCSVVYSRLDPIKDGIRATFACGGHPVPYLLTSSGGMKKMDCLGTILGVFQKPDLEDEVIDLGQGDTLVFYTDGVPEARLDGDVFGEERFGDLLTSVAGKDANTVADVTQTIVDFQRGRPSDDIALLVLRVTGLVQP